MLRLLSVLTAIVPLSLTQVTADEWRQFRGPGGRSVADGVSLPLDWSVETGANIAWDADLPGNGVSSPIVTGGRVIVTAASGPDNDRLHTLAFDSRTGAPLWRRQIAATGRTLCYRTSSVAAPTPATDGQRVYAFYSSNDLACYSVGGDLLWVRALTLDHPGLGNDIGMAASPVLVGGAVVVLCETKTASFVGAYDQKTGATLWETPRAKESNWTSPLAVAGLEGGDAVALLSDAGLALHDAATGAELWKAEIKGASIPSPSLTQPGMLLAPVDKLSYLEVTRDGFEPVWRGVGAAASASSPVLYGDFAYVIGRGGILSAVDVAAGKQAFKERLKGSFWATPLASGGRLYCFNQDGKAFVVDAATGDVLSKPEFGEAIYGSPAAADGGMFIRSNGKLWKIATLEQAGLNRRPAR